VSGWIYFADFSCSTLGLVSNPAATRARAIHSFQYVSLRSKSLTSSLSSHAISVIVPTIA
jgi:hypothetical protein